MMLKTLWKDPVWSKVISAVILAAASAAGTYALNWWPIIGNLATRAGAFGAATSNVANWLLGVLALMALPALLLVITLAWIWVRPTKQDARNWRAYVSDEFFGLRWQWQYSGGVMSDMYTFCPHCDFQVYPESASAYSAVDRIVFRCESCHHELGVFDESYGSLENKAKRFAQQKIRNDTWSIPSGTQRG